eukprot:jgi/Tetstr1/429700/TSEL_019595.t1
MCPGAARVAAELVQPAGVEETARGRDELTLEVIVQAFRTACMKHMRPIHEVEDGLHAPFAVGAGVEEWIVDHTSRRFSRTPSANLLITLYLLNYHSLRRHRLPIQKDGTCQRQLPGKPLEVICRCHLNSWLLKGVQLPEYATKEMLRPWGFEGAFEGYMNLPEP